MKLDRMNGSKRTNYCGTLRKENIGEKVTVCGWVQRQRDLGGLIFVDLRDRSGIVQLAFDDTTEKTVFEKAFSLRSEFVVMAEGTVRMRSSINTEIPTGDIEIEVANLKILGKSETPPFEILNDSKANEELRLKYRYLDLRRPNIQNNILMRHKITKVTRDYFDENGFVEIETPTLIKSTPEGARDYLVPSRIHKGSFFALPQSPQLYKQLLMLSGFDRYMQIARCYRDEDLRADRQPEFTQIDLEMSFVEMDPLEADGSLRSLFIKGGESFAKEGAAAYKDFLQAYKTRGAIDLAKLCEQLRTEKYEGSDADERLGNYYLYLLVKEALTLDPVALAKIRDEQLVILRSSEAKGLAEAVPVALARLEYKLGNIGE